MTATPTQTEPEPMIQPACSIFRRFLKRQGLKFTTERAQILHTVLSTNGVFEADQLMEELRGAGRRVSKATVYRTLKHLQEAKIISEVLIDSRQSHYELTFGRKPQGHLVCVETGRIVEIPSPWLEAVRRKICEEHGFEPVSHRFVIYGLSPEALAGHTEDEGPEGGGD